MLVGTGLAATMHLLMVDCPTDRPHDPSCIQVVAMDFYGPAAESEALCNLNKNFINPNIPQTAKRHLEVQCWNPQQLRKIKTVL